MCRGSFLNSTRFAVFLRWTSLLDLEICRNNKFKRNFNEKEKIEFSCFLIFSIAVQLSTTKSKDMIFCSYFAIFRRDRKIKIRIRRGSTNWMAVLVLVPLFERQTRPKAPKYKLFLPLFPYLFFAWKSLLNSIIYLKHHN